MKRKVILLATVTIAAGITILVATVVIIYCMFWSAGYFAKSSDIPGIYIFSFSAGTDTLKVSPPGTFEQTFVDLSGAVSSNRGTWKMDGSNGVFLRDFLLRIDSDDKVIASPTKSTADLQVQREVDGTQYLVRGEGNSLSYRKKL